MARHAISRGRREAIRATFLLSNAVPQCQAVNQGRWAQLEAVVRGIAAESDVTWVVTGPILSATSPETIGGGRVAVPTHIFKVLLAVQGNRKRMYAAIVPNAPAAEPLNHFAVTVAEVQRRTGFDFLGELEDTEEEQPEGQLQSFPQ